MKICRAIVMTTPMIAPTIAKRTKYLVKSRWYSSKVFWITSPRLSSRLILCSGWNVMSIHPDRLRDIFFSFPPGSLFHAPGRPGGSHYRDEGQDDQENNGNILIGVEISCVEE